MKPEPRNVEISADAAPAYEQLREARRQTLVAPEDDMWAAFADLAAPHALTLGAQLVGRFSVDEERRLHGFYVGDDFEAMAPALLAHVVEELGVSAAMASTVDPLFLARALAAGGPTRPVALIYDHVARPETEETLNVRLAVGADHAAAVAFCAGATGAPESFLVPYTAERIDLHELLLVEDAGAIVATGECRVDRRAPGHAHLGLVIGAEVRGQGLGSRLLHTLTGLCVEQGLTPRCSTEPTNLAAQRAIRRAGFRVRHQVLRVAMTPSR
ncbi:hypothetical protein BH11ACT8_BH11ACT8_11920 [soil metagenome]